MRVHPGAARIVVDTVLILAIYHVSVTNWGHWERLCAGKPLSEIGAHVEPGWLLTVRATRRFSPRARADPAPFPPRAPHERLPLPR